MKENISTFSEKMCYNHNNNNKNSERRH